MKNTLFFANYKALHVILILIFIFFPCIVNAEEINVYSGRKAKLIKPLLDKFQKQTGITVNLVTSKSDVLIKRLEAEGESSPADIFITVDAGRLERAKQMNLLQNIDTNKFKISSKYIDKDKKWVALSKRIRTIVFSKKNVKRNEIMKFEELSSKKWKNRICVRSSNNIYNQSLVASLIFNLGQDKTEKMIKKIVDNFARKPSGNDRAQITAVAKNECDIAIVNHYYYILMLNSKDEQKRKFANQVDINFLNQNDRGAHVNISGVGIVKNSKNIKNAHMLINFLLKKESQEWYAKTNNEYPVLETAKVSGILKNWGQIKLDEKSINQLGLLNPDAVKLMDRVGWK